MAVKNLSTRVAIIGRGAKCRGGSSAVDKSAYISRTTMYSEYDGTTYYPKYTEDLVHNEVMLPVNAPAEYSDPSVLWNSVEMRESKSAKFFPGVEGWFECINSIGKDLGLNVEHYIISSGLHEIIEGSNIYKEFKEVFACEYLYDENDVACWPKNAVNYTTKTQFLFRINKGVLDISNDGDLNSYTPEEDRRVPFGNMVYIGDGLTDVPCMKLVKVNGGYSIAVYQKGKKEKVENLLLHNRVDFIELADYSEGSELEETVRNILCKISMTDSLLTRSKAQRETINRPAKQNSARTKKSKA